MRPSPNPHRQQPVWHCVGLPGDARAAVLGCEHETVVSAELAARVGTPGRPLRLGGRWVVPGAGAAPAAVQWAPRILVCGRSLPALLPPAASAVWQRLDQALDSPWYVIGADWLTASMNDALLGLNTGTRAVVPIRIGDQGALWLGPQWPPGCLHTGWAGLRTQLRQARPLRGFLLDHAGGLPDLRPDSSPERVGQSLGRAARLLSRWPARRLLYHGVLALAPEGPARLHRLPSGARRSKRGNAALRPARRWISPLTGPIQRLHCAPHEQLSQLWVAYAEAADGSGWANVDALLQSCSHRGGGGCAEQPEPALRAAMAEAFERLAAVDDGSFPGVRAAARELDAAFAWSRLAPLAAAQSASAGQRLPASRHPVPRAVADDAVIDWLSARCLGRAGRGWVPRAHALFGPDGAPAPHAHSDGLAAAPNRHQAIQRGLLELVERDAVGIWWHGRILRPAPPASAWEAPVVGGFAEAMAARGRRLRLLDLTHDLGVPVVAAISADLNGERVVVGAAAGWSFQAAARAAVLELAQMEPLAGLPEARLEAADREWRERANLRDCPWLVPQSDPQGSDAPTVNAGRLLRRLRSAGLHALWLDLSRAWMPVAVVRVMVPGLCSHRPVLGFPRLREVPARLGWRTAPGLDLESIQLYW